MSSIHTVRVDRKSNLWSLPVQELGATKQNHQEPDKQQTKGSWSLSSPQEGMAVSDSLGKFKENKVTEISVPENTQQQGSELTSSSQNLHPSNGWCLERCRERYCK